MWLNTLTSGTLDVIVEGAVPIPVFVKDAEGVAVGKILKLNQTVHPVPAERHCDRSEFKARSLQCLLLARVLYSLVCHRLHELIDELVVLLPSDSLVLQSDV